MLNTKALKMKMIEVGKNYDDLAKGLNYTRSTVYAKIHNKRPCTLDDAEGLQRELEINDNDFGHYFMYKEVV